MDSLDRLLNNIISSIDTAIKAVLKILDRAIDTIQSVSRRVITLLFALFRLSFYLVPFILFVVIGISKNWLILWLTGGIVLLLVLVLFIRDYRLTAKDNGIAKNDVNIEKSRRVVVIMNILNIVTIGYAVLYFFLDISLEQILYDLVQSWLNTMGG